MRPMKPGAARSALADNATGLLSQYIVPPDLDPRAVHVLSAVLGGAIEAALEELHFNKDQRQVFWRLTNENCWRMTRSLRASGQLEKIR